MKSEMSLVEKSICIAFSKSLSLSDAYMHHQTRLPLSQIMACCLFGTIPLSEPMIFFLSIGPLGTHFSEIWIKTTILILSCPYCVNDPQPWLTSPCPPVVPQTILHSTGPGISGTLFHIWPECAWCISFLNITCNSLYIKQVDFVSILWCLTFTCRICITSFQKVYYDNIQVRLKFKPILHTLRFLGQHTTHGL